jgi:hypothetical protein
MSLRDMAERDELGRTGLLASEGREGADELAGMALLGDGTAGSSVEDVFSANGARHFRADRLEKNRRPSQRLFTSVRLQQGAEVRS